MVHTAYNCQLGAHKNKHEFRKISALQMPGRATNVAKKTSNQEK
jgi:hypothetical protein